MRYFPAVGAAYRPARRGRAARGGGGAADAGRRRCSRSRRSSPLTGALHEDGLADTFDGSAAPTRERALEIMRDSRIGT